MYELTEVRCGKFDATRSPEYSKLTMNKHGGIFWPDGSRFEFEHRPYVYAINPNGQMVKCYRSYLDYCD